MTEIDHAEDIGMLRAARELHAAVPGNSSLRRGARDSVTHFALRVLAHDVRAAHGPQASLMALAIEPEDRLSMRLVAVLDDQERFVPGGHEPLDPHGAGDELMPGDKGWMRHATAMMRERAHDASWNTWLVDVDLVLADKPTALPVATRRRPLLDTDRGQAPS